MSVSARSLFSVFSDVEKWQQLWPEFFGPASWVSGEPWQLMSRIKLNLRFPVQRELEAILLSNDQLTSAWLVRGQQVAVQQWYRLEPQPEGGVVFSTHLEMVGVPEAEIEEKRAGYTELYRRWFAMLEKEALRLEGRQTAQSAPFASLMSWL